MACKKSDAYYQWVGDEARAIGSDGCTFSHEWAECCCFEHDLAFHYGRDARHAYTIWSSNGHDSLHAWQAADVITFLHANNRFASCLPWYLKYRWLGVMSAGYPIWKRARAKDVK